MVLESGIVRLLFVDICASDVSILPLAPSGVVFHDEFTQYWPSELSDEGLFSLRLRSFIPL